MSLIECVSAFHTAKASPTFDTIVKRSYFGNFELHIHVSQPATRSCIIYHEKQQFPAVTLSHSGLDRTLCTIKVYLLLALLV